MSARRGLLSRWLYPSFLVVWLAVAVADALTGHPRAALIFAVSSLGWAGASLVAFRRPHG